MRKLNRQKKYQEAIIYAEEKLNKKYIYQPLNLMRYLAATYKHVNEIGKANSLAEKVLKYYSKIEPETLVEHVHYWNDFDNTIHSNYIFQGGAENLGVVIHESGKPLYFTKVLPYFGWYDNREIEFFQQLNQDYKELIEFVPRYISNKIDKEYGIQYLTTIFIDKHDINLNYLNDLIEFDNVCRKIDYKSIHINQGSYHAQNRLLHDPILIHTIVTFLRNELCKTSLNEEICLVYNNIKKVSKLIKPENDYCFVHNDLHHKNVFMDKSTNRLVIMDWNTYGWGLKGSDIVRFVSHFECTFDWFKTEYLDKQNDKRSKIQNIMLVFLLIYGKYIQNINFDDTSRVFYLPALKWINSESEML